MLHIDKNGCIILVKCDTLGLALHHEGKSEGLGYPCLRERNQIFLLDQFGPNVVWSGLQDLSISRSKFLDIVAFFQSDMIFRSQPI